VLPGLVIFIWLFLVRRWTRVPGLPWFSGLALFGLLALPWFVLAQRAFPGMFDYLIIGQHFQRYTGTTFNNQWSGWLYIPVLAGLLFPWALLTLWDGAQALLRRRLAVLRAPEPWTALMWVWLIAITVFFSLPKSKLVGYILPVLPPLTLLAAQAWESRWGTSARAGRVFALLCALNIALALTFNHVAGLKTLDRSSADVAKTLACRMQPGDAVWVTDGYPYDLPFLARLQQAVVVLDDWPTVRQRAGDNWQRELFEGADFDAQAAQVLQNLDLLDSPPPAHTWLVTGRDTDKKALLGHWRLVMQGRAWALWQPLASAHEGPKTAEHKGLDCR